MLLNIEESWLNIGTILVTHPAATSSSGGENVPIKILMKFQTHCNKGLIRETNRGYVALKEL